MIWKKECCKCRFCLGGACYYSNKRYRVQDYFRGSENGGINGQIKHGNSWINEVKEEGRIKDEFKVS